MLASNDVVQEASSGDVGCDEELEVGQVLVQGFSPDQILDCVKVSGPLGPEMHWHPAACINVHVRHQILAQDHGVRDASPCIRLSLDPHPPCKLIKME